MAIMMRAATQHSRTNSPTWSVTLGAAIPTEPTHRATTTYPWAKSRRRPGPLQVDIVTSIDDMDDDEGVVIILLLARALKAAYGDGMRFDAFLDDEDDTVRILVAGDGDYDDFPAPLAHKIAQNI